MGFGAVCAWPLASAVSRLAHGTARRDGCVAGCALAGLPCCASHLYFKYALLPEEDWRSIVWRAGAVPGHVGGASAGCMTSLTMSNLQLARNNQPSLVLKVLASDSHTT